MTTGNIGSPAAPSRGRDAACLLILAVVMGLFNWPFAAGALPADSDNILYQLPLHSVARERPFALWNPYAFCGMPLLGNLQAAIFYPPRLAFRWFDGAAVYGLFTFAHWVWAAWGAYALGRAMQMRRGAALLLAITFACGSHIQGRVINPSLFLSATWMPWVLAGAVVALREGSFRGAALLALAAAMLAHAGSPHMMFFGGVAVGVLAVWRCAVRGEDGGAGAPSLGEGRLAVGRAVVALGLAAVLGGAMFAPTGWHAMALLPRTIRAAADFAAVTADPLLPREIPLLWLGGIGTPEYGDKTSYTGMLPLALLLVVAATRPSWGRVRGALRGPAGYGLTLALAGVLIALGARGGVYHVIYQLPGFRFLIGPARALILFNLGWAIVVGCLAHAALDRIQRSRQGVGKGLSWQLWSGPVVLGLALLAVGLATGWHAAVAALARPGEAAPGTVWLVLTGLWLAVGGLAIGAAARLGPVGAAFVLALGSVANLLHFHPRVYQKHTGPGEWASPEIARTVKELHEKHPGRVLAFDASRLYALDLSDRRGSAMLAPSMPTLNQIPEAQGYDPMMSRDYVAFLEALAGRHPSDDPFRSAHAAAADTNFTHLAGASLVVGWPHSRPVGNGGEGRRITLDPPRPLTAIGLVSFAVNASGARNGEAVGRLLVRFADGGTSAIAIRTGIETADITATDPAGPVAHDPVEIKQRWRAFDPAQGRVAWLSNYYARVAVPTTVPVAAIAWEGVPGEAAWMVRHMEVDESRPSGRSPFEEIARIGTVGVFKNHAALPLAFLAHETTEAATLSDAARLLGASELPTQVSVVVEMGHGGGTAPKTGLEEAELTRHSANHIEVRARASSSALLVVLESFDSGWAATVDGRPSEVLRANGLFIGLPLEAGEHVVHLRYWPRALTPTLVAAVLGLLASAALIPLPRRAV